MKFSRLTAALLLLASPAWADGLPDLGEVSQNTFSPQQERRAGEQVMQEIRADRSYLDDPEVTEYINDLGYRLVAASTDSRRDFEFFVLQDRTINAFALPGGFIGIHTATITAAQSESELASVLSHEIAHVTQKHMARVVASSQNAALTSMAALAIAILAARNSPEVANAAIATAQASSIQNQLDYTRDHEREADRIGLQVLQQAGFDVHAMPAFFERLQKSSRLYENNAPAYLRTHPLTTERIADIENRVATLPYRQVPDSMDFRLIRAKVGAMQGTPDLAVRMFEEQSADASRDAQAAARYGLVVALLRANQLGRAQKEMAALRATAAPSAIIENLAAQISIALGQYGAAQSQYAEALKRFPQHRALAYGYAEILLQNHQEASAAKFLDEQVQQHPGDYHFYELQAKTFAAQGKSLLTHKAKAEAYARSGNIPAALEQLQIALKSPDGDFYQLSMVEARLKELKALDAETRKK
jgi:predicted Zn-dependent protease